MSGFSRLDLMLLCVNLSAWQVVQIWGWHLLIDHLLLQKMGLWAIGVLIKHHMVLSRVLELLLTVLNHDWARVEQLVILVRTKTIQLAWVWWLHLLVINLDTCYFRGKSDVLNLTIADSLLEWLVTKSIVEDSHLLWGMQNSYRCFWLRNFLFLVLKRNQSWSHNWLKRLSIIRCSHISKSVFKIFLATVLILKDNFGGHSLYLWAV